MLESVVGSEQGTGIKARIDGYRVAGKTGTANRVDPKTGRYKGYTASFIGFAPADDPRVTVSCVIQNPTRGSYFGGSICGPVFKQVMEFALKTLRVPPSGSAGAEPARRLQPGGPPPRARPEPEHRRGDHAARRRPARRARRRRDPRRPHPARLARTAAGR